MLFVTAIKAVFVQIYYLHPMNALFQFTFITIQPTYVITIQFYDQAIAWLFYIVLSDVQNVYMATMFMNKS